MGGMTPRGRPRSTKAPGVEKQTVQVLGRLQSSLRELIRSTPGSTRRPADLTETLGIHYKLAWQVHRLAHAPDPLAQAGNVPGPTAMERFLQATAKRGAPADSVDAVRVATRECQGLISVHAGSRSESDSIISGLSQEGSEQVDLTHKRAAFRAQSHFLGVQAEAHVACYIFRPSHVRPSLIDAA